MSNYGALKGHLFDHYFLWSRYVLTYLIYLFVYLFVKWAFLKEGWLHKKTSMGTADPGSVSAVIYGPSERSHSFGSGSVAHTYWHWLIQASSTSCKLYDHINTSQRHESAHMGWHNYSTYSTYARRNILITCNTIIYRTHTDTLSKSCLYILWGGAAATSEQCIL